MEIYQIRSIWKFVEIAGAMLVLKHWLSQWHSLKRFLMFATWNSCSTPSPVQLLIFRSNDIFLRPLTFPCIISQRLLETTASHYMSKIAIFSSLYDI